MEKLFESVKEATYDIIGYILPGLIVVYLALILIIYNETPLYMMFTNAKVYKLVLDYIISLNIIFLLVVSFIAGNLVNFIANFIENILYNLNKIKEENKEKKDNENSIVSMIKNFKIIKFLKRIFGNNKKDKLNSYINKLEDKVLEESKYDIILKNLENKDSKLSYLQTKASTISRFKSNNDLIQKYIYKSKLSGALSCIFLILSIDAIISMIRIRDIKCIIIVSILLIISRGFYKEYKRHNSLRNKESYMYILHIINAK